MPALDTFGIAELIKLAYIHGECRACGHRTAMDYCRTCDEFYWIHSPGCLMYAPQHHGHRTYLIPYVEVRLN